jgi:hypothetical protein
VKKYLFLLVMIALTAFMFLPLSVNATCGLPTISSDYTTIDFLAITVGNKSATTTLTITNTSGCATLNNASVSLTGESGEFNIESNTCTGTLASGATCQVGLSFSPSSAGAHSASLTLTGTEATFTDQVALSGTGITSGDNTALLIAAAASRDNSSGCDATASTGVAGGKSFGPAALGFIAIMGLVLGVAAIRRRTKKSE